MCIHLDMENVKHAHGQCQWVGFLWKAQVSRDNAVIQ